MVSPASIAFSKRRLHRSNIQLIIPSGENGGYSSVSSVALDVTLAVSASSDPSAKPTLGLSGVPLLLLEHCDIQSK